MSIYVIAELVVVTGPLRHERHPGKLASRPRKRAVGAGAKHRLMFVNRLLATLVRLRHATVHGVPACWFDTGRSTITRAIGEVRRLLAERGCTVSPDVRLRTLAEVIGHLGADRKTWVINGTEFRARGRPPGVRTGTRSSPARASRTRSRAWSSADENTFSWRDPTPHTKKPIPGWNIRRKRPLRGFYAGQALYASLAP
ncbi:transposase family protein [Streptomyces sp. NRRL S-37]|uniref:transposase family protein n=1 Tax=Streptomyces sp. NRRL S-37 TaxID=1463903 RepID=UPI001F279E5C|nr:transposase family protein [Streptomyces sp. NRRL S-37]